MIEEDVIEKYAVGAGGGGGRLRVVVITDGVDNLSTPAQYRGMEGMDAMMRVLVGKKYDIEWHIIVLGSAEDEGSWLGGLFERGIGPKEAARYRALAEATGGGFLLLGDGISITSGKEAEATKFFETLQRSGNTETSDRQRIKDKFQRKVDTGVEKGFDWVPRLGK